MDRLSPVTRGACALLLGVGLACQQEPSISPTRQRAEVVARSRPEVSAAAWCDVYSPASSAPALSLPPAVPLGPGASVPAKPTSWVWLNLWATWCKPCVRELPLVVAFGEHLRGEGMSLENWYLSLDAAGPELQQFVGQHPELRGIRSLRVSAPDDVDAWIQRYGLKSGTAIPVNVLVAPGGGVRCVRAGSIAEGDYARVRAVLQELQ